jgi:hypothetical protein
MTDIEDAVRYQKNIPELHIISWFAATPHSVHTLVDGLVCIIELSESIIECVTLLVHRRGDAIFSGGNQFARVGDLCQTDKI